MKDTKVPENKPPFSYKKVPAQIYNFQYWTKQTCPKILKTTLDSLLKQSNYTVIQYIEHHFPVSGFTAIWLLAESHLAVHTFPTDNTSYIELSGCNKEMNLAFETLFFESVLHEK